MSWSVGTPNTFSRQAAQRSTAPPWIAALAVSLVVVPLVIAGHVISAGSGHPAEFILPSGLIASTMLNLFVVPSVYWRYTQRVDLDT